jgi:DNA-binding NarL/FixJ family response regulator
MESIATADPHYMISNGLDIFFEEVFGHKIVMAAKTCSQLLVQLDSRHITHLVAEMNFADGCFLQVARPIKERWPHLRILLYTALPVELVQRALPPYGIEYVLHKKMNEEVKRNTFHRFFEGDRPAADEQLGRSPFIRLSSREAEVLIYLLQGKRLSKIAVLLELQFSTVFEFQRRAFEKINVANLRQAIDLIAHYTPF